MTLAWILGMDEDIIKVHNDKDIMFFYQNHIDVPLETYWGIR